MTDRPKTIDFYDRDRDPQRWSYIELEPVLDQVEEWQELVRKIGERLVNGVTVNDLSPPLVSMDDFLREHGRPK